MAHPSLNRGGGAEKVCLTVLKALSQEDHKVRLATIDKTDWSFLEDRFGALCRPFEESYLMRNMPINSIYSQGMFTLSCFLPVLFRLRQSNNDLTVNTYGDLVNSFADICYINALPTSLMNRFPQSQFPGSFPWRLIFETYGFSLNVVDKFFRSSILLTNSGFTQKVVSKYLNRDSIVVYPPVDVQRFKSAQSKTSRDDLVVTASRLRPGKHLEFVPMIAKLVKNVHFAIFGLADRASEKTVTCLAREIERLQVGNRVDLLLNQSFRRLMDALSSAKVFLHTQPTEAFGISIVEAMASGCVPVVPRAGGPWSDILDSREGEYGFSYGSISEAAEKISLLMQNGSLRKQISSRARRRAASFDNHVFEKKIAMLVKHARYKH